MPGMAKRWLELALHPGLLVFCALSFGELHRGWETLLNCGQNVLRQSIAPKNLPTLYFSTDMGMVVTAWMVMGLGWTICGENVAQESWLEDLKFHLVHVEFNVLPLKMTWLESEQKPVWMGLLRFLQAIFIENFFSKRNPHEFASMVK